MTMLKSAKHKMVCIACCTSLKLTHYFFQINNGYVIPAAYDLGRALEKDNLEMCSEES